MMVFTSGWEQDIPRLEYNTTTSIKTDEYISTINSLCTINPQSPTHNPPNTSEKKARSSESSEGEC